MEMFILLNFSSFCLGFGFVFFFSDIWSFYWCACVPESHCLFHFSCLGVLTQCHNEEEAQKQSRLPPKGQAEMLSALLLLILQCWMTMQNTSYGHPIPDFVVAKWILGRQTSWYTAGLFQILLINPIPCFQTHTVVAFRSKRLASFLGSRWVVPGRRGSWYWGNYCVSFLYLQTGSLYLNTRKIKIIVHNTTAPISKSPPSKT